MGSIGTTEAATRLGISKRRAQALAKSGRLRSHQPLPGGAWIFLEEDIDAYRREGGKMIAPVDNPAETETAHEPETPIVGTGVAAARLGISKRRVQFLAKNGQLKGEQTPGGEWTFTEDAIASYVPKPPWRPRLEHPVRVRPPRGRAADISARNP